MQPLVKVENLDVIYFLGKSNQVNALTKINAEIYPGEFVIFFGPSGCGKSTLLNSIAGLEQATHGNVFVDDKNLTKFNQKELEDYRQRKIGMIFQAYYLINSLSVLKNVTLPQLSLNAPIKEREEKAMKLLEHFGIGPQALKIPSELSGGQQQRVAISRSLINNPEIILADEPTGNLDSKSDFDVMELLKEMNSKDKKTVILVTHSPAHLHYANRVFFLKDGMIIDTKVNRALAITEQAGVTVAGTQPLMNKDLELLTKTFAMLTNATADQLIPIKAQEIVTESLTNMTAEEMAILNKKVEVMLQKRLSTSEEIFKYLDRDDAQGGLAMNKIQAQKLADKIAKIVAEIKILEKDEKIAGQGHQEDAEVKEIRHYLFDVFDIKVANMEAVWNVNRTIKERLENKINLAEAQKRFDLSVIQGGAGMDKRLARKAARRLELLILGKYNPNRKDKHSPPKMPPTNEIQNSNPHPTLPDGKLDGGQAKSEILVPKLAFGQRLTDWWKRVLSNLPLSHNTESMGLDSHFRGDEKKKVAVIIKEKLSSLFLSRHPLIKPTAWGNISHLKEKIIPLRQNVKQILFKIGSFFKRMAWGFGQILFNAATCWSGDKTSNKPKPPLAKPPILPPSSFPTNIINEPLPKPNLEVSFKTLFNKLKAVSEKIMDLTAAINRTLRKTALLPVRGFYWLRKMTKQILNKILKK